MQRVRDDPSRMARKLRIQYAGAVYHVMNRGDRREAIFHDDQDRRCFVDTLGEACAKTAWQVHAYCLMPNHFHLVVETPQANLVAGMKWLLGAYTGRFNRRHRAFGHLFSGHYKALIAEGSGNGYLRTVCGWGPGRTWRICFTGRGAGTPKRHDTIDRRLYAFTNCLTVYPQILLQS